MRYFMYLLGILSGLTFIVHNGLAQEEAETDTTEQFGWKHSLVAGANLSQVALSNWEQGGEDAFSWTLLVDGKSEDDEEHFNWSNTYAMAFGQARLGEQSFRKTDDKIDLSSVFTYKVWETVNPYGAATMQTQFATGYTYDDTGRATAVSKFADPLYLTQTAGFSYKPIPEFTTRLGAGLREIITSEYNKYADDPETDAIETTAVEGGMESVSTLDWPIAEDLKLTSKLNIFAPFETMDRMVVQSTTTFSLKAADIVTALVGVEVLNDPRVSPKTQLKETLSIGLSFTLL